MCRAGRRCTARQEHCFLQGGECSGILTEHHIYPSRHARKRAWPDYVDPSVTITLCLSHHVAVEWVIQLFELRLDGGRDQLPAVFYEEVINVFAEGNVTTRIARALWQARPVHPRSSHTTRHAFIPFGAWTWLRQAWRMRKSAGIALRGRQKRDSMLVFWQYTEQPVRGKTRQKLAS